VLYVIYACEDCGFLFFRVNEARECPSCEKTNIRLANPEEIQRLQKLLEERDKALSKEE
jgi:uncharacterized Zn finger protein (UPF0148 family)